ncbi:MAG: hypothetical protein ABSC22_02520 [Roseiarcus sp.]|jgi:hypothetical protein
MPSLTLGQVRRSGLALTTACALGLGFAAAPARAGDDGAAPIWVGLGSIVGLTNNDVHDPIEYRDHGRLVVPPKIELPPPAASPTRGDAAWPVDPDVQRRKKEKAAAAVLTPVPAPNKFKGQLAPDPGAPVTVSATAGMGPGGAGRPCDSGPGSPCETRTSPTINYNPLTWVGLEKKPQTVLGPEPDRDWLTDPPKGYRAPAEGVGVKLDN